MKIIGRRYQASITVWESEGALEYERPVGSIRELFQACTEAPPSRLVRLTVSGPEGEVTLQFASFIRKT